MNHEILIQETKEKYKNKKNISLQQILFLMCFLLAIDLQACPRITMDILLETRRYARNSLYFSKVNHLFQDIKYSNECLQRILPRSA